MTPMFLLALCLLFLATVAGMAALLFGKGWWSSRREAATRERLRRHADLVDRLRQGADEEYREGLASLRAISGQEFREAVLDAALEGAGEEGARRIA
ncbi:MAG: hypothetical protein E4G97_01465, partial [Deltaproteobacteria bacterium]